MNDDDWIAWAEMHATTFGLLSDGEREMVHAWRSYFEASGFTLAELQQASRDMMAAPPKWRADHLQRIQDAIVSRRMKLAQAEIEAEIEADRQRRHDCQRCKFIPGYVIVPSPSCIRGDMLIRPYCESLVTCDCNTGRRLFNEHQARFQDAEFMKKSPAFRPPASIDQYERRFPHWEMLMQQRELAREEENKAKWRAAHADRQRGPIPPVAWTEVAAQCSSTKSTPTA